MSSASFQSSNSDPPQDARPTPPTDVSPEFPSESDAGSLDDRLRRCDDLRNQRRPWDAQAGCLHVLEHAAEQPVTAELRRVAIGAARRALTLALEVDDVESVVPELARKLSDAFRHPQWRDTQHLLAQHLSRTIEFELSRGRSNAAIEQFEMARRLAPPDTLENRRFARLALQLQRRTPDAADLYVTLLEGGDATESEQQTALALLRDLLRVDLVAPSEEQLPTVAALCARLRELHPTLPWISASLALIHLRQGALAEAVAERLRVTDLTTCDPDSLLGLAVVAYRARRWTDVSELLDAHGQTNAIATQTWSELAAPLRAMTRVNQLLFASEPPTEAWEMAITEDVATLEQTRLDPPRALDVEWVKGAARVLLGQFAEAAACFDAAASGDVAWRYAELDADCRVALGRRAELEQRLAQWQSDPRVPPALPTLLRARESLARGKVRDADHQLRAAQSTLRSADEADLHLFAHALALDLATCRAQTPEGQPPPEAAIVSAASVSVRARFDRATALWHVDRGEFDAAAPLLDITRQFLAAPNDMDRLTATAEALRGVSAPSVGDLFARAAAEPLATFQDRLAHALWASAQPQPGESILAQLDQLLAAEPACLEAQLAKYHVQSIRARSIGEAAEAASSAIEPSSHESSAVEPSEIAPPQDWLHEATWTHSPRLSVYRPWYGYVPEPDWRQTFSLSPHRIADMLRAADLLLGNDRASEAVGLVDVVRRSLGPRASVLGHQLAAPLRTASLQCFRRAQFEEACALHSQVVELTNGENDDANRSFATEVAEALANYEATPPDAVLEVLVGWLSSWQTDAGPLEQTAVGRALRRFLLVDDETPGDATGVTRRKAWSQRVAAIRPDWSWAPRNLARVAMRERDWIGALEQLHRIENPTGADWLLRGRACWQLLRYEEAARAFADAAIADDAPPDASAWQSVADAAAELAKPVATSPQLSATEADRLLPHLDWRDSPADLADFMRLMQTAVLLAADRAHAAVELLDAVELRPDLADCRRQLLGLAFLQLGRDEDARRVWSDAPDGPPTSLGLQALRLWAAIRDGNRASRPEAWEALNQLRRRGARHAAFDLCEGTFHLIAERSPEALAALQRRPAEPAGELEVLLRPLEVFLAGDQAWLSARACLANGDLVAAATQLERSRGPGVVVAHARFVQAALLDAQGRAEDARLQLEQLVAEFPHNAEFVARHAHVVARHGAPDDARRLLADLETLTPAHPLAALARAELAERQGDLAAARAELDKAWEQSPALSDARERALVAVKRARLDEQEERLGEAEEWWERAVTAAPRWSLPARRLALSLALRATGPADAARALQLADTARQIGGDHPVPALARALALVAQEQLSAAAEQLADLIRSPEFGEWPIEVRRAVVAWGANVQAAAGRFGAAADSIELLRQLAPDEEEAHAERLDQFRLLHVQARLAQRPLGIPALNDGLARAEQVLASRPDHPLANLLVLLCRAIRGERDTPEVLQIVARLPELKIPSGSLELLANLLRQLFGVADAALDSEASLSDDLRLLLANQRREPTPLIQRGWDLSVKSREESLDSPIAADDLVRLAALQEIREKREQSARELVELWCQGGRASQEVRLLWAQLLARQGAAALRGEDIERSRALLATATAALSGATLAN